MELKADPEPGENLLADRMYFWEKLVWQNKEKMVELKMLEEENSMLSLTHEKNREELQARERELTELDLMEAELEYKIGISNALVVERIRYLEEEIANCQTQIRDSEMAFERMEEATVNDNFAAPDVDKIVEM